MSKTREYWADAVKSFAIWLMVLCHYRLRPAGLHDFIYIFHMPVFFLASGYFDKGNSLSWELVKKNFKHIMVPYFFFSVCSFSICWISPYVHPELYHNGTIMQSFGKALVGMLLMDDTVRPYAFMPTGPLWFLVALFEIKILFSFLCFCLRKYKWVIPVIAVISVLVVWNKIPFFSMDSALLSMPFYVFGFLLKRYSLVNIIISKIGLVAIAIVCWTYLILFGVKNGTVDVNGLQWGNNLVLFYLNAIVGSVACICTFKTIDFENVIVSKIGSCTLSILGTHGYIDKIFTFASVLLLHVSPSEMPIWYILLMSFVALAFGVFVDKVLTKYLPWSLGKSK